MHPTGGAINYDLWMQRITAVVPSSAYAEKIRCLYENYEIMIFHQITNAANVARDAILYVFTKKGGMLVKLGIRAKPLLPKNSAMCLKDKSQIISPSSLNLKANVHSSHEQDGHTMTANTLSLSRILF